MLLACVIPARYNSSRFPGKLLVHAHGKTVLQHTFESVADSPLIDALYVATDDERIKRIDLLYTDMQDKYSFCQSFSEERSVLAMQRLSEQVEILMSKKLNGIPPAPKGE